MRRPSVVVIHPRLTVDLNPDKSIHSLLITRPDGTLQLELNDYVADIRGLSEALSEYLQTHRTERERNALASSALDSIEAGTAPEEASFTQGQLPPPSLGFEAYMKAKYGDSYIPFVGMSEIPTIQENWEQGPRPS